MLQLVDFPTPDGLRSLSPFGYKAEALLAMSRAAYTKIPPDPAVMPHGKVPVLRDGDTLIPDSALIQRHLEASGLLTVDRDLTARDRAVAQAFRQMAEEHLRWVLPYMRWIDPACETAIAALAFAHLEGDARREAYRAVGDQVKDLLHTQGIGRHTRDDIYRFAMDDLDAIAAWLDDKPFFLGDVPTSVDATIAGLLYGFLALDVDTPLTRRIHAIPALPAYVVRFERTVFADRPELPAHLATRPDAVA